jgi:CO/xanthine dehydrogenase Mo-binding subunit/aerobic-type carbon monoxide dehydrogenase small subunit (CoxS/CutS family)
MCPTRTVNLRINHQDHAAKVDADLPLVRYLRDELRLTGTKVGCTPGDGDCGVCTVLVDGAPELACLVNMDALEGRSVETIEGEPSGAPLDVVQEAFVKSGAIQCGFCIPAYVLAARALLEANPAPTVGDIKRGLKGILCRCTGYRKVIQAVQAAAHYNENGGWPEGFGKSAIEESDHAVRKSVIKVDAVDKATGREIFADDVYMEGMLYGKLLYSDRPSAKYTLDISGAERSPGVAAVLTEKDVQGTNKMGVRVKDKPVFARDKIRSVADALAAVFAETPEQAEAALQKIKVDYEDIPGVFSPEAAPLPDAPIIHEDHPTGNILHEVALERGDVDRAFAEAHLVVEGDYSCSRIDHCFLEPESGVAYVDERGILTLMIASQCLFMDRDDLCQAIGLPKEKMREVVLAIGGAFGGKEDLSLHPYLALGALKTGRPVKITVSRAESLLIHHRKHPMKMHYRTAVDHEGRLTGVETRILADGGPYAYTGPWVIGNATMFSAGPYEIPNLRLHGRRAYTNNIPCGSFRGFGINQVSFAMESQMDIIARKLEMDPFELRLKNILRRGSTMPTGVDLNCTVGIEDCLTRLQEAVRPEMPFSPRNGGKVGIGVASAYKNIGVGQGRPDRAGAIVELLEDGSVRVRTGAADIGGGQSTVIAQIASETLGIPYEDVKLMTPDTELTLDCGRTAGSRQTYTTGNAVYGAAKEFREKLFKFVSENHEIASEDIEWEDGKVFRASGGKRIATNQEVVNLARDQDVDLTHEYNYLCPDTFPPVFDPEAELGIERKDYRNYHSFTFVATVAVVEVREDSGEVDVLKMFSATDCGTAIYPLGIEGQVEGSVVQAMGYALSEEYVVEDGIPKTRTLTQLGIPTIEKAPEIVPFIIEEAEPEGPYGAKGIAEASLLPGAPAIINAVHDAVGVRATDLPLKPDKLRDLLDKAKKETAEVTPV